MTWKETDAMKERVRFVLEWERRCEQGDGFVNLSELCREFGISRVCGYKWLERYRESRYDVRRLEERSRRPHRSRPGMCAIPVVAQARCH